MDEDWINVSMIYGEYAFETNEPVGPGTVIYLNRKAEDMKGDETSQQARIWVDESKGKEIETNDSNHAEKRLLMPEYVYDSWKDIKVVRKDIREIQRVMNGTLTGYNQAFDNLMVLHNALAENIAKHIKMTNNVASTTGEMWKTVREMGNSFKEMGNGFREMRLTLSEFGKNYRLSLIGQILLYGLIALLIIKEVIT